MIVIPSGERSSDPAPRSSTSGRAPRNAAMVVIMIGGNRNRHASRIASNDDAPRERSAPMAKSTIMIAFFFTMPISSTMPTSATNDRSIPHSSSASMHQMSADGSVERIVIG